MQLEKEQSMLRKTATKKKETPVSDHNGVSGRKKKKNIVMHTKEKVLSNPILPFFYSLSTKEFARRPKIGTS
jgi:hypothetical protein